MRHQNNNCPAHDRFEAVATGRSRFRLVNESVRPSMWMIATWIVGGMVTLASTASAQVNFRGRFDEQPADQILLAPRPITRLLKEGKTAIDEKRYADGISALGTLLLEEKRDDLPEDTMHQDFFTEPASAGYFKNSVRGEALRILGSIPEEGRKTLELQYGVAARQALKAAVEARDMDAIADVTRKYYHTEAGYDASVLLAQEKLVRGYPIAAAGILKRLSEFPAARKRFGAALIGELASAWMQAGRIELAIQDLEQYGKLFEGASILLGNQQVKLETGQDWRAKLQASFPQEFKREQQSLTNWTMTGGEPARNGSVSTGLPLPTLSWDITLHRDATDEETVEVTAGRLTQRGNVLLPKLEARMVNDLILAKTATADIFAIDTNTGLRLWPFFHSSMPMTAHLSRSRQAQFEMQEAQSNLAERIWDSSAFGQFTCDQNHLYYINSADDQPLTNGMGIGMAFAGMPANLTNYLIGVSLASEGKMIWRVGGPTGDNELPLAGTYFLGPPLSYEGELYILGEINGETRLLVLDARSGKLQWSQQLMLSANASISRDYARQAQALSPSIADAVIVCPCGSGMMVAVDMLTRSLMWAKQYYAMQPERFAAGLGMMGGMDSGGLDTAEDRWQDPVAVIHKGQVILTPPETSSLVCLDLLTGVVRWQQPRGGARYVAGVHKESVIVVANTEVYALNLSDGRPAWADDVPLSSRKPPKNALERANNANAARGKNSRDRETVAGKSVRDGKFLYVPTSHHRVLKIDLDEGRFVDAVTVEEPLGSLFAYKDRMISVSPTRLTAYYTGEALAEQVDERLAKNPNDTWALNHRAQILLSEDRFQDAIQLLRKSYGLQPEDGETRYLLASALLTGLENNFDEYLDLATQLEPLMETQHFRFLTLLAQGNLRNGQYSMAFDRLFDLMKERIRVRQPSLQVRTESIEVKKDHVVDVDVWIATQLARAFYSASEAERIQMLEKIKQRVETLAKGHPISRDMELQYLSWLDAAHPTLLSLAQNLFGQYEQTSGEQMIQPIIYSKNSPSHDEAMKLLEKINPSDVAMGVFTRGDELPESEIKFATGVTLLEQLSRRAAAQRGWPTGVAIPLVDKTNSPHSVLRTRVRQVSQRWGRPEIEMGMSSDTLTVFDEDGHSITTLPYSPPGAELRDDFLRCHILGGLIVLETQSELIGFDLYRAREAAADSRLWRYSLLRVAASSRTPSQTPISTNIETPLGFRLHKRGNREATVGPLTPVGILIQKETTIQMLGSMTGNVLWSRGGYDDRTVFTASGLELAIVNPSTGKIDVLDCRDGELIRQLDYKGDWNTWMSHNQAIVQIANREATAVTGIQSDTSNTAALRIIDAFTGQVVVEKEFEQLTRADMTDDRFIVAIQPSGKLWYCDLETMVQAEHDIPKLSKLSKIRLQRFDDRLILLPDTQTDKPGVKVYPQLTDEEVARGLYPVNGKIFALNIKDGKLVWERPGTLLNFVFPSSQPRKSPFMACYRILESDNVSTGQIVLLDLRDGTIAYVNSLLTLRSKEAEFGMRLNPLEQTLSLDLGVYRVRLKFEDERPPQPVCNYGFLPATKKSTVGQPFDLFR